MEQLQLQLGRKLKTDEMQFLEWLEKRMKQEEKENAKKQMEYKAEYPPHVC